MIHEDPSDESPAEDRFRPEAIAVRLLLSLPGWSQARLAAASGVDQSLISLFQRGKLIASPEQLGQFARAVGWPLSFIEPMAAASVPVREHPRTAIGSFPLDSPALAVARKTAVSVEAALVEIGFLVNSEAPDAELRRIDASPAADDEVAEDLWTRMADLDARQRRVLVDFSSAFHRPSLALRLAEEGKRLEAERPEEAAQLARLALHVTALWRGDSLS